MHVAPPYHTLHRLPPQASRVRKCPGTRHACRQKPTAFAPVGCRPRLASLITQPPLAPVKRGRGAGGEGAKQPEIPTQRRSKNTALCSGWKARATCFPLQFVPQFVSIRVHSCPFVVQNAPLAFPFASSRLRVSPHNCRRPNAAAQISGWKAQATCFPPPFVPQFVFHSCPFVVQNLLHSCPFVVQNAPLRFPSHLRGFA